jgi:hypothetical protein
MAFPPKVYLIGAHKACTTTLAYLSDQHPQVTVSRPSHKEMPRFTGNFGYFTCYCPSKH